MSAGILLIDGYNLLHAAGMAQSHYRPGDLLRCRTRLLRHLLDRLTTAEIRHATVVFDARDPPPDRPAQIVVSGLKVLFANPGGDADALIMNWLAHHATPRRVTLVSSDRALQRAARSAHSQFVACQDFLNDLERRRTPRRAGRARPPSEDDAKPSSHLSPAQTAYWLQVFGDIPLPEASAMESQLKLPAQPEEPVNQPVGTRENQSSPTRRKPPAPRDARAQNTLTPGSNTPQEELDYWLKVFGEAPIDGNQAAPQELRISELESWLRAFELGSDEPDARQGPGQSSRPKRRK
jgi:predicted RNA-binding protein with PIN domain